MQRLSKFCALTFNQTLLLFDWRPCIFSVPRSICHRLQVQLKGVPRHLRTSTIRLQILNLSGYQMFGFAWRQVRDGAEVWYWDESSLHSLPGFPLANTRINGVQPVPESLFRSDNLIDGLHLLTCTNGYEAISVEHGEITKTRWFSIIPGPEDWIAFVRDSGKIPSQHPQPALVVPNLLKKPAGKWAIQSNFSEKSSLRNRAVFAGIFIFGALMAGLLAYDLKQSKLIAENRQILEQLKADNNIVIELQGGITWHSIMLDILTGIQAKTLQLRLMQALAEADIFADGKEISLVEWEYRNDRLRLLFSIPRESFSLAEFLEKLENLSLFREIRIMTDTPPHSVGIQAIINESVPRPSTAVINDRAPGDRLEKASKTGGD